MTVSDITLGWLSPNPFEFSGYGHIAAELKRRLERRGITILPLTRFGWDALVICSPPAATLIGPWPRPDVIYHTMFEAEPVPPDWVNVLNRVGMVWVPSHHSAQVFARAGVERPIMVGGYGIDPDVFAMVERPPRDGPYRVLAWGDILVSRKNILHTIETFVRAELSDAVLEVKLNDPHLGTTMGVMIEGVPSDRVRIINDVWSTTQLVDWLTRGDVFLYLSGGEGFGLMPLQAIATGLPVICAYHTGMREYVSETTAFPVPGRGRIESPSLTTRYGMPITIEEPDWDRAIEWLRWCEQHRDSARSFGMRAAHVIRQRHTWDHAVDRAVAILRTFVAANRKSIEQTIML